MAWAWLYEERRGPQSCAGEKGDPQGCGWAMAWLAAWGRSEPQGCGDGRGPAGLWRDGTGWLCAEKGTRVCRVDDHPGGCMGKGGPAGLWVWWPCLKAQVGAWGEGVLH